MSLPSSSSYILLNQWNNACNVKITRMNEYTLLDIELVDILGKVSVVRMCERTLNYLLSVCYKEVECSGEYKNSLRNTRLQKNTDDVKLLQRVENTTIEKDATWMTKIAIPFSLAEYVSFLSQDR
jgi:hypothetical protein